MSTRQRSLPAPPNRRCYGASRAFAAALPPANSRAADSRRRRRHAPAQRRCRRRASHLSPQSAPHFAASSVPPSRRRESLMRAACRRRASRIAPPRGPPDAAPPQQPRQRRARRCAAAAARDRRASRGEAGRAPAAARSRAAARRGAQRSTRYVTITRGGDAREAQVDKPFASSFARRRSRRQPDAHQLPMPPSHITFRHCPACRSRHPPPSPPSWPNRYHTVERLSPFSLRQSEDACRRRRLRVEMMATAFIFMRDSFSLEMRSRALLLTHRSLPRERHTFLLCLSRRV